MKKWWIFYGEIWGTFLGELKFNEFGSAGSYFCKECLKYLFMGKLCENWGFSFFLKFFVVNLVFYSPHTIILYAWILDLKLKSKWHFSVKTDQIS